MTPHTLYASILVALLVSCSSEDTKSDDTEDTGGTSTYTYDDADRDGIIDGHDGYEDPDLDGKQNFEDPDSDGDGIPDRLEAGDADVMTLPVDSDQDAVQDFLDEDSDNNCILDQMEAGDVLGEALARVLPKLPEIGELLAAGNRWSDDALKPLLDACIKIDPLIEK